MLDQKPKIVDLWKHLDNVSPAGPVHKYPGIVHLGINFDLSSLTNHLIDIRFYNSDQGGRSCTGARVAPAENFVPGQKF